MKAMNRGPVALFALLAAAAAVGPLAAQKSGDEVPRLMVLPFRGNEKGLGPQASEEVRQHIASDVSVKQLAVIAKTTVCANLEASGFSCDSAPDALTARLLATTLRTEEYVEGNVNKTGASYKLDVRYYVTGFIDFAQPLPSVSGTKLGDLASQVSKSFQASRKQVPDFVNCMHKYQNNDLDGAILSARAAITIYPNSTIGRVCLANAWVKKDFKSDSIVVVATRVTELDPRNKLAWDILGEEFRKRGQAAKAAGQQDSARFYLTKAVEAWGNLIAIDPKNPQLVSRVVNLIGASGYAAAAKPIIIKAVDENPGDPDLIKLEWQILLATRDTVDTRRATVIGEDMVRVDTSAADTTFFIRQAAAYAQLQEVKQAVTTTSTGLAKFPLNPTLWAINSQVQRLAGNPQAALDAASQLIKLDSSNSHSYILAAQANIDLQRPDQAIAMIRLALKPPKGPAKSAADSTRAAQQLSADSAIAGKQLLLVVGNQAFKAAKAAQPQNAEDYKRAVAILSLDDSIAPSPQAKFVKGLAAFSVGDLAVRANVTAKRCDLAKEAQDYLLIAQINVAAGGSIDPKVAQQILGALQQYTPAVDGQLKKFCK